MGIDSWEHIAPGVLLSFLVTPTSPLSHHYLEIDNHKPRLFFFSGDRYL
ncbi:hypothetical protein ACOKW7_02380 [Limnospira platensis CENA597]